MAADIWALGQLAYQLLSGPDDTKRTLKVQANDSTSELM
jgi:hypothetical protein